MERRRKEEVGRAGAVCELHMSLKPQDKGTSWLQTPRLNEQSLPGKREVGSKGLGTLERSRSTIGRWTVQPRQTGGEEREVQKHQWAPTETRSSPRHPVGAGQGVPGASQQPLCATSWHRSWHPDDCKQRVMSAISPLGTSLLEPSARRAHVEPPPGCWTPRRHFQIHGCPGSTSRGPTDSETTCPSCFVTGGTGFLELGQGRAVS